MKKLNKFILFLITVLCFTYAGVYFSDLIANNIQHGWHYQNALLKVTYIENTGAAFSILQDSTRVLISLSIVALLFIFYYIIKNLKEIYLTELFFWSLLISGIAGNLHERLSLGHVRDFFDLSFVNFPVFNISDIFINIGVLGIIILILLSIKSSRI